MSPRPEHIDADLGPVLLACAAVLAALIAVHAVQTLRHTAWWKRHVGGHHPPLAWCRIKAAARALRGRPAWRCGLCHRPVALEHDTCRACTLALRDAFRYGDSVYDWREGGL